MAIYNMVPPTTPNRAEFMPIAVSAMGYLRENYSLNLFEFEDIMVAAAVVCPGLDFGSYGVRATRGGGVASRGRWAFAAACGKLVKSGVWRWVGGSYGCNDCDPGHLNSGDLNSGDLNSGDRILAAMPPTKGVLWDPGSFAPKDELIFGGDVYLSRCAADQTPCFGGWSPDHHACKSCVVASKCFKVGVSSFGEIGRMLDERDKTAILSLSARQTAEIPVNVDPVISASSILMTLPLDTVCSECSKVIKAGSLARSVPGIGIFHVGQCC